MQPLIMDDENNESNDILNQIRIPLSDICGISRLLKYNLKNSEGIPEPQVNSLMDLVNALDENTTHIVSLLNENLEKEYSEKTEMPQETMYPGNSENEYSSLENKKVLVVDDIELNRVLVGLMLRNVNMQVMEAVNGQDALEILSKSQPGEYSVVLMDIMMPVMDGYTATAEIRKNPRKDISTIPVLAVTANAFEYYKKQAEDYGMNGYVTKPLMKEKLYAEIMKVVNK